MKTKILFFLLFITLSIFADTTFHAKLNVTNPMFKEYPTADLLPIFSIERIYTNAGEENCYLSSNFYVGLNHFTDFLGTLTYIDYRGYLQFNLRPYSNISNSTLHFKALSQLRPDYTGNTAISITELDSCYLTPVSTKAAWNRLSAGTFISRAQSTSPNGEVNLTGLTTLDTYLNKALAYNKVGFGVLSGGNAQGLIFSTSPGDIYLEFDYTIGIPNIPTGLFSDTGATGCMLYWNESSSKSQGYNIYVYKNGTLDRTIKNISATSHSFYINNLEPATTYTFTVSAYNEAGETAQSTFTNVLTKPLPPTNLSAPTSCSSISLFWLASTGQVSGYKIYQNNILLFTTSNLNVQINNLTANQQYIFSVSSYNQSGESDKANITITPATTPDTPLSVPFLNLISPTGVYTLYWRSVTNAVGYKIYRCSPVFGLIGSTTNLCYYTLGLASSLPSGANIYGVSAYNESGCESNMLYTGFYIPLPLSKNKSYISKEDSIEISSFKISAFPNPVIDKLYIDGISKTFDIDVTNLQGQIIKSETKLSEYIDLSELKSGVYIVKIKYDGNEIIHRIIKQ